MNLNSCLVDKAVAIFIHEYKPFAEEGHPKSGLELRGLETDQTGQSGHVPEVGTDLLGHSDPVSSVARISQEHNRFYREIIPLHRRIVLISAACQYNRPSGLDIDCLPSPLCHHADDLAIEICNQFYGRRAGQNLDSPIVHQAGEEFP